MIPQRRNPQYKIIDHREERREGGGRGREGGREEGQPPEQLAPHGRAQESAHFFFPSVQGEEMAPQSLEEAEGGLKGGREGARERGRVWRVRSGSHLEGK